MDTYWYSQLDEAASVRRDQRSFHVFAEGQHSDVRGQIFNLGDGAEVTLPHDRSLGHLFIVIGIRGTADGLILGELFQIRAHSQLVVLPGTPCKVIGRSDAAFELISLISVPARAMG
jgi:hypothetical protein